MSAKRGNPVNARVAGHVAPPNPALPNPSKKLRRRLTTKQQALVRALTKTKHQGKAAIVAGYSPKHPRQSAYQALESIRKTAPELLARHGLDDDSLMDKHLLPLMKAERSVFAVSDGHFSDERKRPDWPARKDGLDMAFKIRGLYVREQEGKNPEFSVVIDSSHRPDWAAMKRAKVKTEFLGLNAARMPWEQEEI